LTSTTIKHIINFIGVRNPGGTGKTPEKSGTRINIATRFFVSEVETGNRECDNKEYAKQVAWTERQRTDCQ
jgi:hypothetical protein